MAVSDILRIATAGSVDDGKSSLIGRLLYDSKSILEDQLLSIERASRQRGSDQVELALLTDGLRAEREQNITIDVAYRYFATDKRKFIIADTPGHLQYTRNMVTGASTADLSVILIDARKGVLNQSKRHAAISALLGIRHLVVAVNKMDLVDFREETFRNIVGEFGAFLERLGVPEVTFIPISALLGDNVVDGSWNMPWYAGPPLLEHLESVNVSTALSTALRLPVQYVIRASHDFRGFSGRIESGTLRVGEELIVAASGLSARVESLRVSGIEDRQAQAGDSVAVSLDREIDISRGDLLYGAEDPPQNSDLVTAIVCWMHEQPLEVGRRYWLLHAARRISAVVQAVHHRVDIDTLDEVPSSSLAMNEIGQVVIRTAQPLFFDAYTDIPGTGGFVLADAASHKTVAAGLIQAAARSAGSDDTTVEARRGVWLEIDESEVDGLVEELREFRHGDYPRLGPVADELLKRLT